MSEKSMLKKYEKKIDIKSSTQNKTFSIGMCSNMSWIMFLTYLF